MTRRQLAAFAGIALSLLAIFGILRASDGPLRVCQTRATPEPLVMEMHNYDGTQYPPEWGNIGSWMYWGTDQLAYNFDVIDAYLAQATAPVAISIMLIEGIGADSTPYDAWGIPEGGWTEGNYSYPRWNDTRWDGAMHSLITRLGARYDKDSRVHSIWICTGLYGEAIFEKDDWKATGHNPGRWVQNAIDWYAAAFPSKPLFFIGSVTARSWCEYAASKGVGVKLNSLGADLPTHWRPRDGSGSIGIMNVVSNTVSTAWEHAFANQPAQAYHAMLTGLAFGMDVLDLPEAYLQTMAETRLWTGESLLIWTQRLMRESYALWYGRETAYPCPAGAYDCGWPGPFVWRAECTNFGDNLHTTRSLPVNLSADFGAFGAGILDGSATFAVRPKTSRVHVSAIVAGNVKLSWGLVYRQSLNTGNWELLQFDAEAENWDGALLAIEGEGHLHMLLVEDQPDSPVTATPTPTFAEPTSTPTPYSTETPIPLTATPTIKPTDTMTPTETPKPNPTYDPYDVYKEIEALKKRVQRLEDALDAAIRSYEGDGK